MTKLQKICFIGLGNMGYPMVNRLLEHGFEVAVCDTNSKTLEHFSKFDVVTSKIPYVASYKSNLIITMLPTSEHVKKVLFGREGAVKSASPKSLFVDMSTGSFKELKEIEVMLSEAGHRMLDAPVGRSKREAKTGNLLIMVGGSKADVNEAMPIFEALADTIIHFGEFGTGLKMKLVNNYMSMVNSAVTGETLAFAKKIGLDIEQSVGVLSTTAAGLGQLNTNYKLKSLAEDFTADFPISMAKKDLSMALELAKIHNYPASFGICAKTIFEQAEDMGFGELDHTAVLKFFNSYGDNP